jgi:hypothetical protein
MKEITFILFILLSLVSCNTERVQISDNLQHQDIQLTDTSDMTNNFYDNTETVPLSVSDLVVEGEIANPGRVDYSTLPLRSVIVKETLLDSSGGDRFVGAYRYDGYSLFDILDKSIIKKSNIKEFNPIIDLFVEIENEKGEKVVFSWGEIYYPNNLHKIIIATRVSRIVPSKTKELWPLPVDCKIVAASDLVTERNISSPVKITVRSYPVSFKVNRELSPLYSSQIELFSDSRQKGVFDKVPEGINNETFNTIFYGRGKGIHSTTPFTGIYLKDILLDYYPGSRENLMSGIMCFAGIDGYRCAVSYSELFNRNDQQEFLLIKSEKDEDGGLFRIFAASDFFSDRAIKSLSEIHLNQW